MAREPTQIAKDFLDDVIRAQGFEPDNVYALVQALEDDPELIDVKPSRETVAGVFHIRAKYTGELTWIKDDDYAEKLFDLIASRTNIEFINPYVPTSRSYYSAQVRVATDESMALSTRKMRMTDGSHYNIDVQISKKED